MKTISLFSSILLLSLGGMAEASTTLCSIQDSIFFKSVGWNTETKEAKVVDPQNRQNSGKVVLIRDRPEGVVTNIEFAHTSLTGDLRTGELMIFSVSGNFRVIGVGFTDTTPRRIDFSYGSSPATCVTM
ncbi:hypothetical protein [Pseudomonas sp. GL-B-16]|uniref:hypothetical protein n=1 Tax=Pseudomonas sp. GL-B-16 TaxID=2832373 RepID=UPI001CBDC1B1|nr:hypothetical protein [Pseudomonas sp. GL-B-16]